MSHDVSRESIEDSLMMPSRQLNDKSRVFGSIQEVNSPTEEVSTYESRRNIEDFRRNSQTAREILV